MAIFDFLFGSQGQTPQGNGLIDSRVAEAMANPQPTQASPSPQASPSTQASGILSQMGMGQGALSDPQGPGFMKRLGNALMAAGSRDPALTLLELQKADSLAAANKKPKITPLADGAFSLISYPDGTTKVVRNDDVANYLGDMQTTKFQQALEKVIAGKKAEVEAAAGKDDIKRSGDAREAVNQTQALLDGWTKAEEVVNQQAKDSPLGSKIQGLVPGIAGFFGGDQVAANKFLQGLTVDETLLNTARTKGAISDAEMRLFKSPIPSPSDDREAVWKPFIKDRMPVIRKLMEFQKSEAARGDNPAARVTGGAGSSSNPAPAASINQDQVKSAFGSYEPDVYEYRIFNGTVQRKKK